MSAPRIAVAQTGLANLASVLAGLRRVGAEPFATDDPVVFASASHAVLPGVGAFGPAMETILRAGMDTAVRQRIENDRPLLCICLGMQLLGTGSEESPGVSGLRIVDARCERFGTDVRVPQLGWNRVRAPKGARFQRDGMAYFANSYRVRETPPGTLAARTTYGGDFIAAFEGGNLLACQFHPELSGAWGLELLRRWIAVGVAPVDDVSQAAADCDGTGLARRVIPCLDCRNGRVVKGVRFQNLRDAGDPAELAAAYEAQGADEIVLLDVSATTDGRGTARETVARVREKITIPLTVGGGVRTVGDARALLEAGADKVAVNSAAVADPRLLAEIAGSFGRQCAVLAIDAAQRAADRWEVLVHSGGMGTGKDAVEWAREAESLGAGELLLTSWDRDGTRSGYDSALLRAVSAAVRIPVIASGGAASPEHFAQALEAGADAVLAASIFHDGEYTVAETKQVLARRGVEVRR